MAERIADSFHKGQSFVADTSRLSPAEIESLKKVSPGKIMLVSDPGGVQFRPGEPAHLVALRATFPGVWVRDDGSFRAEEQSVRWHKGDPEADESEDHSVRSNNGRIRFMSLDYGAKHSSLKLSQLIALTEYIKVESAK